MKRLAIVLVLLTSFGVMAQKGDGPRMQKGQKMNMTAEEMATMQTKHMTLALDLTEAQQEKVMELNLEEAKIRKARWDEMQALKESGDWKKPTDEERLARQNERLDDQIAFQAKMKEVLNEKQYDDWKEMRKHKAKHGKKKMQNGGGRG
jgi:predicted lipase